MGPSPEPCGDECVLVVGTTGTGKSATIAKMTGQQVEVSSAAQSVTRKCEIFQDLGTPGSPVWIDTMGYDDTNRVDDEESFKEVLKFIQENHLCKVRAIVWTILPQERKDARLQRQAEFINRFREETIWENVIIIAKQPGGFSAGRGCQGAEEAAKQYRGGAGLRQSQLLGFSHLDSPGVEEEQREQLLGLQPGLRRQLLHLTDTEVRQEVGAALAEVTQPVTVVFQDCRCEACGVIGDRRLLPEFCHMSQLLRHPEPATQFHPAALTAHHPLPPESRHPGVLRLTGGPNENCETVKNVLFGLTPVMALLKDSTEGLKTGVLAGLTSLLCSRLAEPMRFRFACCGEEEVSVGCRISHPCCRQEPGARPGCLYTFPCCGGGPQAGGCIRRHLCCNKEEGVAGCREVCKKCEQPWGSPTQNCFRTAHSLVSL